MSFKVHLLIICVVIVITYGVMQVLNKPKAPQVVEPPKPESNTSITVLHASWGLNCRYGYMRPDARKEDSFANSNSNTGPKEDNVYAKVAEICNNKKECVININTETLGKDPAEGCGDKELKVEYRCFSFDRPWIARSEGRELRINCDKQNDKNT